MLKIEQEGKTLISDTSVVQVWFEPNKNDGASVPTRNC
jgi:hypothetical protein